MSPLLSICIPTYNRALLLQRCLDSVVPQLRDDPVEVIIIDNASPDGTEQVARAFARSRAGVRYYRNPENLGYSGNQAKCFEHAAGKYCAILCDDDVYREDAVATMLPILAERDYAFVALNYYGFIQDPKKVHSAKAAPEEDVFAADAYKIFEYPSVGHYSGLVFNRELALASLAESLRNHPLAYYERFRGILGEIAVRCTKGSSLPGYFIGKRIVGAGVPPSIDYDSLRHICIDYYASYVRFRDEGLISTGDLLHRQQEVLRWLPKALLRNGPFLAQAEFVSIRTRLTEWFGGDPTYEAKCVPLLRFMQSSLARAALRIPCMVGIAAKRLYSWGQR